MKRNRIHPYLYMVLALIGVILVGTILLALPISHAEGKSVSFIDSLFLATSAACVTGLSPINITVSLNVFGKIVMCVLMEIGGLSFITIAVFFFTVLGGRIGIRRRFLLRESLNQDNLKGLVKLVKNIIFISLAIQAIGVFWNMFSIMKYVDNNFWKALGVSIFHSVSAFNNSGFDIFGDSSMIQMKDDICLNLSTMFLIILGGLGFVVYIDIYNKKRFRKFSLHTKICLITTIILIAVGTLFYKLTVKDMSFLQAMFASVTARTAGFATYDYGSINGAGYIITLVLMFIGASPCSTGGGVKTTTIAVVILAIISYSRGKRTSAFKRRISDNNVLKALVLCAVGMLIVILGTIIISMIQPEFTIDSVVFEITSAFSTTGLSTGITPLLNTASKIIICVIMFCGRLGPLTVIGIVNKHWIAPTDENIQFIEEGVYIG